MRVDDEWGNSTQHYTGVSENSVPLNPMVLLIIIHMKNGYFIGNIPNIFRQTHIVEYEYEYDELYPWRGNLALNQDRGTKKGPKLWPMGRWS